MRGIASRVVLALAAVVAVWGAWSIVAALVVPRMRMTAASGADDGRIPLRPGEYRGPSAAETIDAARRRGEAMPEDVIESFD